MTTVLVVDDSSLDRRLAGGLLQKHADWEVIYAGDGREGMAQIELHLPDIVLTDMQMPNMNGLELVQAVRKEYPLIPVVLMTAKGSEEIAVQALQAGAASYVPKRQLAHDLVETLERVLAAAIEQKRDSRLMLRMVRHEFAFELETDMSLLLSMLNYLQQAVTRMRLIDETERLRIGVALEEALLNAYYHGNLEVSSELRDHDYNAYYELARQRSGQSPYKDRRIYVEVKLTPEETVYIVRDEGQGFDPGSLPDATDPANLERPSGRGLLLMRTFMDDVRFNDRGNEVTLVKRQAATNGHPAKHEAP